MDGWMDRQMAVVLGTADGRAGKARAKRRLDGITQTLWISREDFRIPFLSVPLP